MLKPNYKDGSIVNMMSSIAGAFGKKHMYQELKALPAKEMKESKNIVLIVLDGVGYEYIKKYGKGSFLNKNMKARMDTVFPPATGAAITTFKTGVAPQQHAFTGWYMHLKEIGCVALMLPFVPRYGKGSFTNDHIDMRYFLYMPNFTEILGSESYIVIGSKIADSAFTRANTKRTKIIGYTTFDGFFKTIKKAAKTGKRRKFIYAYWPLFDSLCHEYGVKSKETKKHFKQLEKKIAKFIKTLDKDTTVIITADHGLIDVSSNKDYVMVDEHPKLKECLTLPLCGDSRVAYCYVHPRKMKQFEKYVKTKLSKYCHLFKSEDLIKQNLFGLYEPNPKLIERIGDYTLIMKKNYVIRDSLVHQSPHLHKGNHGGLSKEELYVPLIVIKK